MILGAVSLDLFAVLFGGAVALLPAYASDILHVGPDGFGWLRAAPGIGAAVVAMTLAWRPITRHVGTQDVRRGRGVRRSRPSSSACRTNFLLSLAALVVIGAADMVSVYIRHMLVQLETPDEIRGRVSAVNAVFIGASNELGEFESGVTAAWWGLKPAVVVGGLASFAIAVLWMRWFPGASAHRQISGARNAGPLDRAKVRSCISIQYAVRRTERTRRDLQPDRAFRGARCRAVDDGWGIADEELPPVQTTVQPEPAHSVITQNNSPDIPFDQSINPYRGCEQAAFYCYARPSHQYLNLSAGLDFETKLFYKKDAAAHLREELNRRCYRMSAINLGANTDPYQPIERKLGVTRSILEVLAESHHPVTIVTKGSLVVRDIDLLSRLAAERLVKVFVSVTTLDDELKRRMEPRAASPKARLAAIAQAGGGWNPDRRDVCAGRARDQRPRARGRAGRLGGGRARRRRVMSCCGCRAK